MYLPHCDSYSRRRASLPGTQANRMCLTWSS
jgi:hypothetical protein